MRRILAGVLLSVVLTGNLSGCGAADVQAQEEISDAATGQKEDTEQESSETNESTLHVAEFPEQYFITYEVTCEDGAIETVSRAKDMNGNVYFKAEEEYLFIKNGNSYVLYQPEDGQFIPQEGKKYQESYVDKIGKEFEEYVKKGNVSAGGAGQHIGEETIAGRTCDYYEISVKFMNFEQKYQFAIDKETYICMDWQSEKNISGYKESGNDSFTCTRFDTEQIDLEKEFLSINL